eukprot:gb/GECH01007445.1/.p1 GENE.gb/GECH01007445.1/~~gb/GECH01007445.1/.p1  ORF type:complete len:1035 (+),score=187.90 gb/GECH01007445.1/:1-3105(+)
MNLGFILILLCSTSALPQVFNFKFKEYEHLNNVHYVYLNGVKLHINKTTSLVEHISKEHYTFDSNHHEHFYNYYQDINTPQTTTLFGSVTLETSLNRFGEIDESTFVKTFSPLQQKHSSATKGFLKEEKEEDELHQFILAFSGEFDLKKYDHYNKEYNINNNDITIVSYLHDHSIIISTTPKTLKNMNIRYGKDTKHYLIQKVLGTNLNTLPSLLWMGELPPEMKIHSAFFHRSTYNSLDLGNTFKSLHDLVLNNDRQKYTDFNNTVSRSFNFKMDENTFENDQFYVLLTEHSIFEPHHYMEDVLVQYIQSRGSSFSSKSIQCKTASKKKIHCQFRTNTHSLIEAVYLIAQHPVVHWIEPVIKNTIDNKYAIGIVHSGLMSYCNDNDCINYQSPIHQRDVTGKGEIVCVGDSGLDSRHCMFNDNETPVPYVSDDETMDDAVLSSHRKISAYWEFMDKYDYTSGHGTHVSGTVAGDNRYNSSFNGIAPKARIILTDLGCNDPEGCKCPDGISCSCDGRDNDRCSPSTNSIYPPSDYNEQLFPFCKKNGGHIHTNSWGGGAGAGYFSSAMEIDQYMHENDDFLVIFSAGNSGDDWGYSSVNSQGNSKNAIIVGSSDNTKQSSIDDVEYYTDYKAIENSIYQNYVGWCDYEDKDNFKYNPHACQFFNSTIKPKFDPNGNYNQTSSFCCLREGYCDRGDCGCQMPTTGGSNGRSCCKKCRVESVQGIASNTPAWVSSYSSRGPTLDYRIKPDLLAPGGGLISARAPGFDKDYSCGKKKGFIDLVHKSGTSMSAPVVAANAALVRQYFKEGYYKSGDRDPDNGFEPSATLVKAMLIASGEHRRGFYSAEQRRWSQFDDDDTSPTKFIEGFGTIRLDKVLSFNDFNQDYNLYTNINQSSLRTGEVHTYEISVYKSATPLKITLVWNDPPQSPIAGKKLLINDLDLKVHRKYFSSYLMGNTMTESSDERNNVEQVILSPPDPGDYTITISGALVPQPEQSYTLLIGGEFEFVSASAASMVEGGRLYILICLMVVYVCYLDH